MQQRRWYDKHAELAQYLSGLKDIQNETRITLVQDILSLITKANPNLINDFISHYRLDLYQNRWYDADPYLWLIYNGLAFGNQKLNHDVLEYLKQKIDIHAI